MRRVSLIAAALVVALLAANTWCLAECAGDPCVEAKRSSHTNSNPDHKIPPCHKSKSQDSPPPSAPCLFSVVADKSPRTAAAGEKPQAHHWLDLPALAVQHIPLLAAHDSQPGERQHHRPAPPRGSTILRI